MLGPAPASTSPPAPEASPSPPGDLHLLMARSVPPGEMDSDSLFGSAGIVGMALAGQFGVGSAGKRTVEPPGSELWISDNGATNHIINDSRNVYDWVETPPGKEKVLNGDWKGMRVIGVGTLNLRMHSKTDFDVKLTRVCVTEGIDFDLFSIHDAQQHQKITLDKHGVHLFDFRGAFNASIRRHAGVRHYLRDAPTATVVAASVTVAAAVLATPTAAVVAAPNAAVVIVAVACAGVRPDQAQDGLARGVAPLEGTPGFGPPSWIPIDDGQEGTVVGAQHTGDCRRWTPQGATAAGCRELRGVATFYQPRGDGMWRWARGETVRFCSPPAKRFATLWTTSGRLTSLLTCRTVTRAT